MSITADMVEKKQKSLINLKKITIHVQAKGLGH
jgi:hypothetical protein